MILCTRVDQGLGLSLQLELPACQSLLHSWCDQLSQNVVTPRTITACCCNMLLQHKSVVHCRGGSIHTTCWPRNISRQHSRRVTNEQDAWRTHGCSWCLHAVDHQEPEVSAPWSLTFDLRERETDWTEENKVRESSTPQSSSKIWDATCIPYVSCLQLNTSYASTNYSAMTCNSMVYMWCA